MLASRLHRPSNKQTKMTLPTSRLRQYLFDMFVLNEQCAEKFAISKDSDDQPLTDEELEDVVATHFADDVKVLSSLTHVTSLVKSRIRVWRSEYNRGLWQQQPTYRSFRYNADGLPINRNANPLTPEKFLDEILLFPFHDPRKEWSNASVESKGRRKDSSR